MSLNDFFDKIYCINLDRRPDRWEASQREFDRIGIEVERRSAQDGLFNLLICGPHVDELLPGEIGAIISQQYLIGDILVDHPEYESVLILEDDVEFSSTFNEDWEQWQHEVPDNWDMIYFGGNLVAWQPDPVSKHVHRASNVWCIQAVGLRRSALEKLWDAIDYDKPIDVVYGEVAAKTNSYLMVPRMTWQRDDYSDIQNAPSNYRHLREGQFPEVMGR